MYKMHTAMYKMHTTTYKVHTARYKMHTTVYKTATHFSILAWRIPWTGGSGELQFMGSKKSWTQLKGLSRHTHSCVAGRRVKLGLGGRDEGPGSGSDLDHVPQGRLSTRPSYLLPWVQIPWAHGRTVLKGSSWAPYSESCFLMGLQIRG